MSGLRDRSKGQTDPDSSAAPATTSTTTTTTTPSSSIFVSAFDILGHLRNLFFTSRSSSSSSSSSSSASLLNPLDGWRVLLFLWVASNHNLFYMLNFLTKREADYFATNPMHQVMHLGYSAVDGFFFLTGYLLSFAIFKEQKQVDDKQGDDDNEKKKSQLPSSLTDISFYYYRRLARLLPPYFLLVILYCFVFFADGKQFPFSLVKNEKMRELAISNVGGGAELEYQPSNCDGTNLFAHAMLIQQLMPFGGCVGYTWSLAIQVLFSLISPFWFRWLLSGGRHRRVPRLVLSSSFIIVVSLCFRVFAYFHSRSFALDEAGGLFVGFFWYSNTLTRMSTFVIGTLAAYISNFAGLHRYTSEPKKNENLPLSRTTFSIILTLAWIISIATFIAQLTWAAVFHDGNNMQTPGNSALAASLLTVPASPSLAVSSPFLFSHLHHLFFHAFVLLGSPLSSFMFAFVIICSLHRLTVFGRILHSITSLSIFFPLSQLSYFAYLLHPMLFVKEYALFFEYFPSFVVDSSLKIHLIYVYNVVFVFCVSLIFHVCFEVPIDTLLRKSNGGRGSNTIRRLIFGYCVIIAVVTVLYHIFATVFMVGYFTPEFYAASKNTTATTN